MVEFATAFPAHGQVRASNALRKQGLFVSPSGVRSIWLRYNLSSMKQRLTALEKMSADQGIDRTEAQVQALERKKQDDETCGVIESHHLGYFDRPATFYSFLWALSREWAGFTRKPCGYLREVGG